LNYELPNGFHPRDDERFQGYNDKRERTRYLASLNAGVVPPESSDLRNRPGLDRHERWFFETVQAEASKAGFQVFLFESPGSEQRTTEAGIEASRRGEIPLPSLELKERAEFKELLEPEYRWDFKHLNSAGAGKFSRILATQFETRIARGH
jgi:hypothetical protein